MKNESVSLTIGPKRYYKIITEDYAKKPLLRVACFKIIIRRNTIHI